MLDSSQPAVTGRIALLLSSSRGLHHSELEQQVGVSQLQTDKGTFLLLIENKINYTTLFAFKATTIPRKGSQDCSGMSYHCSQAAQTL